MGEVKKVIIFGATGNTGLAILRRSIEEKLEVTVYVRTPSKIPEELLNSIKIIEGDVLNKEEVENAIKGQDAFLSALGTGMNFGPTTVISDGCKNILSAMKKHLVNKLLFVSVSFLFPGTEIGSQNFLRPVIEDHGRQLDAIKAESDCIDWVAVMTPRIFNDSTINPYLVGKGAIPGASVVNTAEIADFMVKILNDEDKFKEHCHILTGISSRPK